MALSWAPRNSSPHRACVQGAKEPRDSRMQQDQEATTTATPSTTAASQRPGNEYSADAGTRFLPRTPGPRHTLLTLAATGRKAAWTEGGLEEERAGRQDLPTAPPPTVLSPTMCHNAENGTAQAPDAACYSLTGGAGRHRFLKYSRPAGKLTPQKRKQGPHSFLSTAPK